MLKYLPRFAGGPPARCCPTFFHSIYPNKNVTEAECINAFPTKHLNKHQFQRHHYTEFHYGLSMQDNHFTFSRGNCIITAKTAGACSGGKRGIHDENQYLRQLGIYPAVERGILVQSGGDRKSTRLNSSHRL